MSIITKTTEKNNQNLWNFLLSCSFVILLAGSLYALGIMHRIPTSIKIFDALIITLAVFRITRLMVYDSVFRFLRDLFVKKSEKTGAHGNIVIIRHKYPDGLIRSLSDLFSCPWCIGVWFSLIVSFFFFATPLSWFPIFVLAVAGLSTLIQISINLIGWRAEQIRGLVEMENGEDEYDEVKR